MGERSDNADHELILSCVIKDVEQSAHTARVFSCSTLYPPPESPEPPEPGNFNPRNSDAVAALRKCKTAIGNPHSKRAALSLDA